MGVFFPLHELCRWGGGDIVAIDVFKRGIGGIFPMLNQSRPKITQILSNISSCLENPAPRDKIVATDTAIITKSVWH